MSNKLIDSEALDSFAKKFKEKISEDIKSNIKIPSIEGLASKEYVDDAIAQASIGGDVDFTGLQTKEDEGLNTEDKTIVGAINELKSNTIDYPILDWEEGYVVNKKIEYGDIRRYGAKCDDVNDDADVFQWALDNCCPNGVTVYIPDGVKVLINKEIILKDNTSLNWKYKIKGESGNTSSNYLHQTTQYLFVGEKFYGDIPYFTSVILDMDGVNIRCSQQTKCVCFKAINIQSSYIHNCKFYFPHVFLEGALSVGTKFTRNRIQGFRYAVISSISIINKEHDFDYIKEILLNANNDYSVLNGLLVVNNNSTSSTNYSKYNQQCNDSYFDYNYIAGSTSNTVYPNCILAVETIDQDFIINNNWFEFCKYVVSRTIRVSSEATTGNTFNDNVFQYFHRFFDPRYRYISFKLYRNQFYNFNKTGLKSRFSNAVDDDVENSKSGVIIGDYLDTYRPYITDLTLTDNSFWRNDYTIYFDNGNAGVSFRFSCKETGSNLSDNTNAPYVRLRAIKDVYNASSFSYFNYLTLEDANSIIDRFAYVNTFKGQKVYINGIIYESMWDEANEKPILLPCSYTTEEMDNLLNELSLKADKSELFSGDYEDLINKPVVPNVDEFATKDEIPTFIDLGFYEDVDSSNNSNNNDGNNNNNINNAGNSNIDIEDVNFIHVTKGINLCNDDKAIVGAYSSDGSFSASTKYQYVEIKVKPGQVVKGIPGADINYKLFVLVDDNGNVLGVSDKEGEYVVTRTYTTINGTGQHYYSLTVPEGVSMIYFQYQVSYAGLYNMLVIDNDMPSTYMPYEEKISLDEKIYVQNSKYADYANSITSPLKDKNIGFLGDSFTASDNAYHSFIAERTGCIRYNYGIGGTRITLDSTSGESFIHRVASMRDDLDIICVFGGINDASKYSLYETDHGTINDEILTDEEIQDGTEPLTFYSGVKTLISMLIAKYPEKPIVMIIPPHVLDATYEPALTAYNGIAKIVNALRECAEYYAIPTIDLYKNAQYLNNHPTNVALYRTAMNNIHPNTKAHIRMSYDIQKGLENIIW